MVRMMSRDLREELGVGVVALAKLGPDEQARLLELIHAARLRQQHGIKAAMEGALEFVPAVLRAPVRALFKR